MGMGPIEDRPAGEADCETAAGWGIGTTCGATWTTAGATAAAATAGRLQPIFSSM